MADFDPDAYLANSAAPPQPIAQAPTTKSDFDPDTYLAGTKPAHDFSWGQTYKDIGPEIKKEASSAVSSMVPEVTEVVSTAL